MATVHRFPVPEPPVDDGVLGRLTHLLRLELELGVAETRRVLVAALVSLAVAIPATIALIASLVVLLAGALAPLFAAPWQHLVASGGGVLVLAVALITWSVVRLRGLSWPKETVRSLEENWRWLGAQLRSRLTSR